MEPQKKESFFILPIAIIIAGALIGGGIYMAKKSPNATLGTGNSRGNIEEITINPISTDDHILGNPNAPVVIVEFSDTECPFCKSFHSTLQRIMDIYGKEGKVAWVYRHFPIDQLHSRARKEAEATECANELGGSAKFWEYTNEVYGRTPSDNKLDPKELENIAKDIGLNVSKFNDCLSSGKYAVEVQKDFEDAVRSGGKGTPHSVLVTRDGDKVVIKGAQTFDVIKSVIDAALANQGLQ